MEVYDENESPVFEDMDFDLNENDIGVFILKASDQDEGQAVSFHFAGGANGDMFHINALTGEMKNIRMANFEDAPTLKVKVRATDDASSPLYKEATITSNVQDKNDPPDLGAKMVLLPASSTVSTAKEILKSLSQEVVNEDTCIQLCEITPQCSGVIWDGTNIFCSVFEMLEFALEFAAEESNSTEAVNRWVKELPIIRLMVTENSTMKQNVGKPLVVNDEDIRQAANLYIEPASNDFDINPCSGQITVRNTVLNFEAKESYTIHIMAVDKDLTQAYSGFRSL